MSTRTVDWTALRHREEEPAAEGLRERKKRLLRQRLSDTATELFMDRGFDAVRVSEIADACGVSEKTVFNYFPTKESLVLDLGETTLDSLRTTLADPDLSPVEATREILSGQLAGLTSWLAAQDDWTQAKAVLLRFGRLIGSTPSLRAYQRDMTDRQVAAAAEILARRTGTSPDDPEPQIAAAALLALWPVQFQALRRHLRGARTSEELHDAVSADVERAARLIGAGLDSLAPARRSR
ncbi:MULTISPECIES: TetR family transcriptional regulator [Streptomyces]|jgi:AcrR family transcriptional regulator|uniref:TetR family transcriptional regulator n=1 Tax=Streptomyces doudnae TaxID=3075536 RepID=A0ABD5EYM4_9ACTN|nr:MULTISPECIES: TetR family transcriptional regulator [unclassified Streptomyces]MDT0439793.1 TetR family transcriptional regulator [Streptomyces sp. DSM 41981]MYQ64461.1 TetR family transcriptional regulator [Streptomyces sp. SID4950]SCD79339.1 transcriptional regulator, TetR family [Streptomyces sp. SolWspMP-5a-2]